MTSRQLVEKYKWLTPRNVITGRKIEFKNFTELDYMAPGWRAAFGDQLCEEMNAVIRTWPIEEQEEFDITDIKEKWGRLCIYTNFTTDELEKVIEKFEALSTQTCYMCGATPVIWSHNLPLCATCAEKFLNNSIY